MAYMKFSFKATVELTRIDPPNEIEATVEGMPFGMIGRLTATSVTRLNQIGDETQIIYEIDANLTGKLGSIGQPVLRSKAKEMDKRVCRAPARRLRSAGRGARDDAVRARRAASLRDALRCLMPDDPAVRPIAGGTALMLMMKAGVFQPARLVSLRAIGGASPASRRRRRQLAHRRDDDVLPQLERSAGCAQARCR